MLKGNLLTGDAKKLRLGSEEAEQLSLDHVYLSFTKYLFPMLFTYPNLVLLVICKQLTYRLTVLFVRDDECVDAAYQDSLEASNAEPEASHLKTDQEKLDAMFSKIAGIFALNTFMMINYQGKEVEDGKTIGYFYVPRFFGFTDDGNKFEHELFFELDLDKKVLVSAKMGTRELTLVEGAVTILHNCFENKGNKI